MRKVILALILLTVALIAFGQHQKPRTPTGSKKTSSKRNPSPKSRWPMESRCGVVWKSLDDLLDDFNTRGWQLAATNMKADQEFYYDTQKTICGDDGILRTWIKQINKDQSYTFWRYEFNCRNSQLNIVSFTDYRKNGEYINSEKLPGSFFEDVVPDSIGEILLRHACRKDQ